MDDLKIVFYVAVAIAWVVYNNYKKISEASRKRDLSKPPDEVIQENWPGKKQASPRPVARKIKEIIEKQIPEKRKKVMEHQSLPHRKLFKPATPRQTEPNFITTHLESEGGVILPSRVVQFQENLTEQEAQHPIIQAIKSMDLRTGFVLAEVLKRPYN